MHRALGLAALALTASACHPKQSSATGAASHCAGTALLVTEDGVGTLSLDSSIAALRAQCPQARDTSWLTMTSYDSAIVISLPGATILAIQDSILQPNQPADLWVITGDSVRLPRNLSLTSSWATIARTYGRFTSSLSYDITNSSVVFCGMKGMGFKVLTDALTDSAVAAAAHPTDVSIARYIARYLPPDTCK